MVTIVLAVSVDRLLPYGEKEMDNLVMFNSEITGERISSPICSKHGLPVADGRIINCVYVGFLSV